MSDDKRYIRLVFVGFSGVEAFATCFEGLIWPVGGSKGM